MSIDSAAERDDFDVPETEITARERPGACRAPLVDALRPDAIEMKLCKRHR